MFMGFVMFFSEEEEEEEDDGDDDGSLVLSCKNGPVCCLLSV